MSSDEYVSEFERDCAENNLHEKQIFSLVWSPAGDKLALSSSCESGEYICDARVEVIDGATEQRLCLFNRGEPLVGSLAWHPNNTELIGTDLELIYHWNVADNKLIKHERGSGLATCCLSWNPEGTRLALGGWDNILHIVDESGQTIQELDFGGRKIPGLTDGIIWVGYSPDGRYIATSQIGGIVKILDSATLSEWKRVNIRVDRVVLGRWSPDSRWLAFYGDDIDHAVKICDARTGELFRMIQGDFGRNMGVSWNPRNSGQIATITEAGLLQIWDVHDDHIVQTYQARRIKDTVALDWSVKGTIAIGGRAPFDGIGKKFDTEKPVFELFQLEANNSVAQ